MQLLEDVLSKKLVWLLFIAYCGFIVWMTLLNRSVYVRQCEFCLFWALQELAVGGLEGVKGIVWYLENILLFMPFGFFLSAINECRWKKVVLSGFAVSAVIEITQYITARGLTELDDMTANTIGAGIGFLLWKVVTRMMDSQKKKLRE